MSNTKATNNRATLLAQLAEQRKKLREDRSIDYPVPGYGKFKLGIRVGPYSVGPSEKKLRKLGEAAKKGQPIALAAATDTLIDSLRDVVVLPENHVPGVTEGAPFNDERTTGWSELAELLEVPENERKTTRTAVQSLFATEQALVEFSGQVSEFISSAGEEADEEFSGESDGTE